MLAPPIGVSRLTLFIYLWTDEHDSGRGNISRTVPQFAIHPAPSSAPLHRLHRYTHTISIATTPLCPTPQQLPLLTVPFRSSQPSSPICPIGHLSACHHCTIHSPPLSITPLSQYAFSNLLASFHRYKYYATSQRRSYSPFASRIVLSAPCAPLIAASQHHAAAPHDRCSTALFSAIGRKVLNQTPAKQASEDCTFSKSARSAEIAVCNGLFCDASVSNFIF